MNKELIELYIQCFKEGKFRKDNTGKIAPGYYGSLSKRIFDKEGEVFGDRDNTNWKRKETSEYYEAEQQWRKIVMSKLYRSLK